MLTKKCKKCGEVKEIVDFYPSHGQCKTCELEQKRKRRAEKRFEKVESMYSEDESKKDLKTDFVAEIQQPDIKVVKPLKKDIPPPIEIKKKELEFIKENLKLIILGGFGAVAIKLKQEHWNITEIEADNIASPTMNILTKMDKFKDFAKYSDVIALGVAITSTIVPRILLSNTSPTMEEVNKDDRTQGANGTASKQDKPTNRPNVKKDASNGTNKSIFSEVQDAIM